MSGIRKYNGYGDVMIYGGTRFEFGGSEAGNRFFVISELIVIRNEIGISLEETLF